MHDRALFAMRTFDVETWGEELLALNPWARALNIDEMNEQFVTARRDKTLERHAAGKEAWNAWAKRMLALKSVLEAANKWSAKREQITRNLVGQNEMTRAWLGLACTVLSTRTAPHRFNADISFDGFIFPSDARFQRAKFGGQVDFNDVIFEDVAWFDDCVFRQATSFQRSSFGGVARFQRATFRNAIWFEDTTFKGLGRFSGAMFRGGAYFGRTAFKGEARFRGATFDGGTRFEDATFERAPNFIGAAFKGTFRLDNVKTPRYPWFGYTTDKDATAHFRELRRLAAEAQDRDRELEFFAQEVRSGRFHARELAPWVPKVWSWRFWFGLAFEMFSDFGRSVWRPLLCWIMLSAVFATFYLGEHEEMRNARTALAPAGTISTLSAYVTTTRDALFMPPPCRIQGREPFDSTDAVTEAIQLSLRSALIFDIGRSDSTRRTYGCLFGLEKQSDQRYLHIPARVSTASTMQGLASGILIFLFLLAVRNLLRLK